MESGSPHIVAAACTDAGHRRNVNEDSLLARQPVFVVADGMGGHAAGDVASAAAVSAFERLALLGAERQLVIADVDATIDEARAAVNAISSGTARGAGCTLTGVVLVQHHGAPHWYVINIGDSRVYQHRGATLAQVTEDHSLHAELAAEGHEDAETTPRNVITRALGSEDSRHDGWLLPVYDGMRLLVCSDGLTGELGDDEIRAILTVGGTAGAVAEELVRRACEAGGRDNVTVLIVDTVSGGSPEHDDDEGIPTGSGIDESTLDRTRPVSR